MSFEELMRKKASSTEHSTDRVKVSTDISTERVKKKKRPINENLIVNEFILWVKSLNESNYPAMSSVIRRVKRFKRYSLTDDSIRLFLVYLHERGLVLSGD